MSFVPYAVLWVILVITAAVCLLAARRPVIHLAASLIAPLLALALWFFFRPDSAAVPASFAGRQWVVGEIAWGLTGIALLLLLAAVVPAMLHRHADGTGSRPAWLLGLTAAALPVVWAADDRSRVLAVALFGVMWLAARTTTGETHDGAIRHWLWPLASLFPLWLGAGWPEARLLLSLVAAAMLLGVWPFGGRRGQTGDTALDLMVNGLPVVAGAAVLAAGLSAGVPNGLEIAFATAFAFFSLVAGLVRVGQLSFGGLAAGLGRALAGLALVAAVWAGDSALLGATRLAVFAPAVLVISASLLDQPSPAGADGMKRRVSPSMISSVVVYAAVAGLPLTAGFVALSSLYQAWQPASGWVLVVVLIILLSLWLAAIYLTVRPALRDSVSGREGWLRGGALLLPVLGLLQFSPAAFDVGVLTWVAIAIPPVAGLLLGRFMPGLETLDELLQESVPAALPFGELSSRLRRFVRLVADAIADATSILEGEFGLLWLVGLILLLLWII